MKSGSFAAGLPLWLKKVTTQNTVDLPIVFPMTVVLSSDLIDMTAVEAYFQSFIARGEVAAVYVSDLQGRIIIDSTASAPHPSGFDNSMVTDSGAAQSPSHAAGTSAIMQLGHNTHQPVTFTSNVTVSGAQVVRHLSQLKLGAVNSICAQYKEYTVVQFVDGVALVTLLGRRADHQCAGGLLALVSAMKASPVFRDMSAAIKKGEE